MYLKKCLSTCIKSPGFRCFSSKFNSAILDVNEEVRTALAELKPIVALESTIITHGMPFPDNVKCALEVEDVVRVQGAVPATVAVIRGILKVGLSPAEIERLADTDASHPIKTSRRDFPYVLGRKENGGTTVSGTIVACEKAGITVFATGGLGGVHRRAQETFDISADLTELGRSKVVVVSSGVKSILDVPKTLEYLETQGVFVATIGTSKEFPAFFSRSSGCLAPYCVQDAREAAGIITAHRDMGLQSGMLFAVPVPEKHALNSQLIDGIIEGALEKAEAAGIRGKDVTPFLLSKIAEITAGGSLETNIALIKNNAEVAADIAVNLSHLQGGHKNEPDYEKVREDSAVPEKRPVIIGGCNLDCVAHLEADEIQPSSISKPHQFRERPVKNAITMKLFACVVIVVLAAAAAEASVIAEGPAALGVVPAALGVAPAGALGIVPGVGLVGAPGLSVGPLGLGKAVIWG